MDTVSKQTNPVEGGLDLEVFIGDTNVCERFFVMKPGMMETSVILGQPWQRRYNGVPNWRQEGINFETTEAKFFTPFYDDSLSVLEHSSETNSIKESQAGMLLIEPIALPARSRSKNQRGQQTWQWVKKQTQVQPIKQESTPKKPKAAI